MNIAIIQARMGSSRLPKKVLKNLNGKPMLKFMIERVRKSRLVDKIVIATTTRDIDNPIFNFCKKEEILCFRGSENDVLDRYYNAADYFKAKVVIRLTADCPLIDPNLIDETIKLFMLKKVDYAANAVPPEIKKYPDGSDVEVFSFDNLKKAWLKSTNLKEREHVTFYFWKSNNNFTTALLENKYDWGKYRITVDYEEDFILVNEIVKILNEKKLFGFTHEIIEIIDKYKLFNINSSFKWGANW